MLIALNYHYVRPVFGHPFPGVHGVTPDELESQLRVLANVAEFVTPRQLRDAVRGTGSLPERALVVTFDDGLQEQFQWALPVLDRLGIAGLFFVNTAPIAQGTVSTVHRIHLLSAHVSPARLWSMIEAEAGRQLLTIARDGRGPAAMVHYPYDAPESADLKYLLNAVLTAAERDALVAPCFEAVFGCDERAMSHSLYLSVGQLRDLGARGLVGTHGDEHMLLGGLSPAAVRDHIGNSVRRLKEWTGQEPYALSYPYGSYEASSPAAAAGAASAGMDFAFSGERAGNPDLSYPFHLARFDCNDLPGGRHARFEIETLFARVPPARWYR